MSLTYPLYTNSNFPDAIDQFDLFSDVTLDMLPYVKQYQSLYSSGKFTEAAQLLIDHPEMKNMIINSANLNKIIDALKCIETLYSTDIQTYIMELISFKGEYSSKTKYTKYDVVSVNSMVYMCISLNCPINTPPTDIDYWIPITLRGETGASGLGLSFEGEWEPTRTYSKNSAVSYGNVLYASKVDNNESRTPSKISEYWSLIFDLSLVTEFDNSVSGSTETSMQGAIDELYERVNTNKTKLDTVESGAQVNTVIGVKGNAETTYRTGQVNITPANLGITVVNNTADANKSVKYAISAGSATSATNANYATSSGNADTVDGFHVNTAINQYGLKPISAGTTDLVSGVTTLTQGYIYIVYE